MATKRCIICGAEFTAPPTGRITCSPACAARQRSRSHSGKRNTWSEESRAKLRERGQTENLKLGTAAAQSSPVSGSFESNQEAKIWHLIAPDGVTKHTVRNLRLWAKSNADLFGGRSPSTICHGFYAIVQTLKGNRSPERNRRPSMYYLGWTLDGLPETPNGKEE